MYVCWAVCYAVNVRMYINLCEGEMCVMYIHKSSICMCVNTFIYITLV